MIRHHMFPHMCFLFLFCFGFHHGNTLCSVLLIIFMCNKNQKCLHRSYLFCLCYPCNNVKTLLQLVAMVLFELLDLTGVISVLFSSALPRIMFTWTFTISVGVVFYGVEYLQLLDKHAVYGEWCAAITNVYHVSSNIIFQSCPDTVSVYCCYKWMYITSLQTSFCWFCPDTVSGELLLFHHFFYTRTRKLCALFTVTFI